MTHLFICSVHAAPERAVLFIMYPYSQLDAYWANLLRSEHAATESDSSTDGLLKLRTWLFSCSQRLSSEDDIPLISAWNADRTAAAVYDY